MILNCDRILISRDHLAYFPEFSEIAIIPIMTGPHG